MRARPVDRRVERRPAGACLTRSGGRLCDSRCRIGVAQGVFCQAVIDRPGEQDQRRDITDDGTNRHGDDGTCGDVRPPPSRAADGGAGYRSDEDAEEQSRNDDSPRRPTCRRGQGKCRDEPCQRSPERNHRAGDGVRRAFVPLFGFTRVAAAQPSQQALQSRNAMLIRTLWAHMRISTPPSAPASQATAVHTESSGRHVVFFTPPSCCGAGAIRR